MAPSGKVNPIAKVTPIWEENSSSDYPETIRVPMEDGHVVTYQLNYPHPAFTRAMEQIKNWHP